MKKKILIFIIGVIVGALITTIVFFIFGKTNKMPRGGNFPMNENGEFVLPENMGEMPDFSEGDFKGKMPNNTNSVN